MKLTKISDIVARCLKKNDISCVFAISGGASLHLIHSIAETKGMKFICPQHEQAGAMAADAFSRVSNKIGCAIATSGPGATNLVTGIASSFYDSIPVLFLTGNVATFRAKGKLGVRQLGFQETDFVEMCKTITKYAVLVTKPEMVIFEIEKALFIAKDGRPGPVLIDIPDDIQRTFVDEKTLIKYNPPKNLKRENQVEKYKKIFNSLQKARRPVLVVGWGVHLAGVEKETLKLIKILKIPTVFTWAAIDLIPFDNPYNLGGFGTHGVRYANFTVQNSDFVLAIGSRLDSKATGSPPSSFAREAKLAMVDIDASEISKFNKIGRSIDIPVQEDLRTFLPAFTKIIKKGNLPKYKQWLSQTERWKNRYPALLSKFKESKKANPYVFVDTLSKVLNENDVIVSETGCALAWMMQAFRFKKDQRIFHAFNYTPMGYGLPAAIGAAFAKPGKRVICIAGDGSLQMNIQELITVVRHNLRIKIILVNNKGHGMVQQTQEQWLEGKYYATSIKGGLAFPDFIKVAKAYGFPTLTITKNNEIEKKLRKAFKIPRYSFINFDISSNQRVIPQVQFGRPNEDAGPLLNRKEFLSNMIIKPLKISLG